MHTAVCVEINSDCHHDFPFSCLQGGHLKQVHSCNKHKNISINFAHIASVAMLKAVGSEMEDRLTSRTSESRRLPSPRQWQLFLSDGEACMLQCKTETMCWYGRSCKDACKYDTVMLARNKECNLNCNSLKKKLEETVFSCREVRRDFFCLKYFANWMHYHMRLRKFNCSIEYMNWVRYACASRYVISNVTTWYWRRCADVKAWEFTGNHSGCGV